MAGFYFSKILVFRIDGGAEDDSGNVTFSPQLSVSSTVSVPVATILLVPEMAMGALSHFLSRESSFSLENVQRQGKRKRVITLKVKNLRKKGPWFIKVMRWIQGGPSEA
ncbi:hypothetical protein Fot_37513 [Forsythia ovata]|uniref:Uncharacterized protein n=1 Tax=Forsythia ovata TaxID=205694 RepID=A0ABD1RZY8_9LAMI